MTDTLTIAAPPGEFIESLAAPLGELFLLTKTEFGGITIAASGERWIVLNPNPYAEIEDPDTVPMIAGLIGAAPSYFTLTTSNLPLTRRVVQKLAERRDLVVDTQHGIILPLHEFAELIRARPMWDWRR
ncbi:hypothetical protein BE21_08310 [Sorangium cellulosum]|uniref:Uncharacterized protein n=1 Tax=Sorangium cellulosum TaxID=56 RepID=A0A150U339_SORCE|nr:hypothetical protein BE21_08310 [Sorangium cellulosum]